MSFTQITSVICSILKGERTCGYIVHRLLLEQPLVKTEVCRGSGRCLKSTHLFKPDFPAPPGHSDEYAHVNKGKVFGSMDTVV